MALAVIDVLRQFIPRFRAGKPVLHEAQHRALWAITHCRTPTLGGHVYVCEACPETVFSYHSCNHRSCPQCGREDTAAWVARELEKRVNTPYFMVTFTLPSELRDLFFGRLAKDAFDLFFAASSASLTEKLARDRWLGAERNGFTGVLHTWNQQLHFHPHIHYIVPGGGLDSEGRFVRVKNANFLVPVTVLSRAFRAHFRERLNALGWSVDPAVWRKDWGVDIRPFGSGANAIKYLGAYVCRTAIGDSRVVAMNDDTVSFCWKDRARGDAQRVSTIAGEEFLTRYLRHVLPRGMRSIRYFGFCHPSAKKTRERVRFLAGGVLKVGPVADPVVESPSSRAPRCPCCEREMRPLMALPRLYGRGPPKASR